MIKAFGNIITKEEADKIMSKATITSSGSGGSMQPEIELFEFRGIQGNPNPQEVYKINKFTGEKTLVEKYY